MASRCNSISFIDYMDIVYYGIFLNDMHRQRKFHMPIILFLGMLIWLNFSHAHEISSCMCDEGCYTDEVSNLKFSSKSASFESKGLPDDTHTLMEGIVATNQQFPRMHQYEYKITRTPKKANQPTSTDTGAIGVAVNGVPIFDPFTQGPVDPKTGKRPHTFYQGELDICGGHAGRGDDYHYHIAPICLIEELGETYIERMKRPIGYAMDGYSIHALGWFDNANDVEEQLDECRGMVDENGQYFYNVMHQESWAVADCLTGEPQKFSKDKWTHRKDKFGDNYVGMPLKFALQEYTRTNHKTDICYVMTGILEKEQILLTDGTTKQVKNQNGSIFYCNSECYGIFFQAEKKPSIKGRAVIYDEILDNCPVTFTEYTPFDILAYKGPRQQVSQKNK
jgi:hypothetical protein